MHDPRHKLDSSQNAKRKDIDNYRDEYTFLHEQRPGQPYNFIVRVHQHAHALDLDADEVERDADEGGPGEDSDHT
ncbi:hypothetical protein N7532_007399 [Penicillium argentinense]|uniref:Uncharacterized protein n=1 Tax=Penicillium argentinense TaxID=1131581 RepID=A0A9W9F7P4_9EURO|nr:uncharacterized protein N7532_007399 [Penicillium argentinense]KAJ5095108.1 hypothetical protein N7532_007399 [Penicillium argentinense]